MNFNVVRPLRFVRLVFSFCFLLTLLSGCGGAPIDSSSGGGGNSVPLAISSVSPTKVPVGSSCVTIVVTGTGFTSSSVIQLSGVPLQTAYISSTQIQATIPAAQLQTGAVLPLAVANGANVVAADSGNDVEVDNPEPTVATLAPSSVLVNSAAGTITVTGTNFVSGITPTVNGSPRKTTYVQCDSAHGEPYGRRLPECCACLPLLPWHMCPMSLLLLKNQLGPPPTTRKVFEPFITPMGCSQTLESSSCDHSAVGTEGRIPHLRLAEKCGIPHH